MDTHTHTHMSQDEREQGRVDSWGLFPAEEEEENRNDIFSLSADLDPEGSMLMGLLVRAESTPLFASAGASSMRLQEMMTPEEDSAYRREPQRMRPSSWPQQQTQPTSSLIAFSWEENDADPGLARYVPVDYLTENLQPSPTVQVVASIMSH